LLCGFRQRDQVGFLVEISVDALDVWHAEQAFRALDERQCLQVGNHLLQYLQFFRRQQFRVFHDQQYHLLLAEGGLDLLVVGPLRVVRHQHLVGRDPDSQLADLGGCEDRCQQQQ